MPDFTALTPDALLDLIAERAMGTRGYAVIAVDGADAADPLTVARDVAERLRARGRAAETVSLHDFVRPASVRLEYDRDSEFTYRTGWFDYAAVNREVLKSLRDSGRFLPALWDERADRSARARVRQALPDTVVFLAGPMLLGRGLDFDLTVALRMSEGALRRRTDPAEMFTVDGLLEYQRGHDQDPDLLVAWDHPDRPAVRIG
ncbi:nucleoside/nucleotide kinase family protein [Nocardia heshunensis]